MIIEKREMRHEERAQRNEKVYVILISQKKREEMNDKSKKKLRNQTRIKGPGGVWKVPSQPRCVELTTLCPM